MIVDIMLILGLVAFVVAALIPTYAKRRGRAVPDHIADKIEAFPSIRANQHRVDLVLRDGRVIDKVYGPDVEGSLAVSETGRVAIDPAAINDLFRDLR